MYSQGHLLLMQAHEFSLIGELLFDDQNSKISERIMHPSRNCLHWKVGTIFMKMKVGEMKKMVTWSFFMIVFLFTFSAHFQFFGLFLGLLLNQMAYFINVSKIPIHIFHIYLPKEYFNTKLNCLKFANKKCWSDIVGIFVFFYFTAIIEHQIAFFLNKKVKYNIN